MTTATSETRPPAMPEGPRRRVLAAALTVLVVVVFVLATVFAVGAWRTVAAAVSPERPVADYLRAVIAGDVDAALRDAGVSAKGQPLLSAAAYRGASDRPASFRIASTRTSGRTATVYASIEQDGQYFGQSFTLHRVDGFPARWSLDPQRLPVLKLSLAAPQGAALVVDGVAMTVGTATGALAVLPGTHSVALQGTADYDGASGTLQTGFAADAPVTATLAASITPLGARKVQTAVTTWIDGCARSTSLQPQGCPFTAQPVAGYRYSGGRWRIDAYPRLDVGGWGAGAGAAASSATGWSVGAVASGAARFTATAQGPGGSGPVSTGEIPFGVVGTVTGFDASGAGFVPSPGYSGDSGTAPQPNA